MKEKIVVPVLGESITEATVSKWLKNEGETVDADEPIVELETDKVNLEVPSPISGVLSEINSKDGTVVEVGALLGSVSESGSKQVIKKEIKKIEPSVTENNVVNLEVSKKEPQIMEETPDEEPLILTNEVNEETESIGELALIQLQRQTEQLRHTTNTVSDTREVIRNSRKQLLQIGWKICREKIVIIIVIFCLSAIDILLAYRIVTNKGRIF